MNHIFKIPAFQRRKAIPKQLQNLELLPFNDEFSQLTMPIISNDDLRPTMTGNFFDIENKKIVSTDAHKLTAINMPKETLNFIQQTYKKELDKEPRGVILHTLKQMQKQYNDLIKIAKNENTGLQTFDEFIKFKAIEDGRYPNYDAIIPREFTNQINVDYQKLYWYSKVLSEAKVIDDIDKINNSNKNEYQNKKIEYLKDSYISFLGTRNNIILTYILDDGTIQYISFNAKFLCQILKFAMELNGKTFGKVGISGNSRAMVIELENGLNASKDSAGLIMPIFLDNEENTIGAVFKGLDLDLSVKMYYDLDTNSIISDKVNYPIDESIGFIPIKTNQNNFQAVTFTKIEKEKDITPVEIDINTLTIEDKIKGLRIALKFAKGDTASLIEKKIKGFEIAQKTKNKFADGGVGNFKRGGGVDDYIDEQVNEFRADKNKMKQQYRGYVKDIEYQGFLAIDESLSNERLSDYEFEGEEFDRDNLLAVAKKYPQAKKITFHARLMGDSDFGIEDELSPIDDLAMEFDMTRLNQFNEGGSVEYHDYKGVEIIYEPTYEEYYVNDIVFNTLEKAHKYIDSGEANEPPTYIQNLYKRDLMSKGGGVESQYKKGVVLVKSAKASNDNDVYDILNDKWKKYNIENSRAFDLETPYNRGWIDEGISINVYLLKDTETNKYYWDSDYIQARKNKMAKGGGVNRKFMAGGMTNYTSEETCESADDFNPKIHKFISGEADFYNSEITDLGNLETIGAYANFENSQVTNLGNLQTIGGSAYFRKSQVTNLGNLQTIGGYADFRNSEVTDLGNLQTIDGIAYFDENSELEKQWKSRQNRKYNKGGMVDLFEEQNNLPIEAQNIISKYENADSYDQLSSMLIDMEKIGYTFDYGLDAEPFALRPIGVELNQIDGYEDE